MFVRGKFVTNSSSSSYMVFGIWLTGKDVRKIKEEVYAPALLANADKILEKAKEWSFDTSGYEEAGEWERQQILQDAMYEIDEDEIQHLLLPPPLALYDNSGEGYLYIDYALTTSVKDGQVILDNFTEEEITLLKEFCEKVGINYKTPTIQSWAVWS